MWYNLVNEKEDGLNTMDKEIMNEIEKIEKEIIDTMLKNATILFETSIKDMMANSEPNYENALKSVLHIQISIELFFKSYIAKVYGFEYILRNASKNKRIHNGKQYLDNLNDSEIKTLSYKEIFDFFEENKDGFFDVKDKGSISFYELEVEYFTNTFDKFSKIRNAIVHLGYNFNEDELKWLKSEFTVFIIFVVYKLLKHIKKKQNKFNNYYESDEELLYETPNEIFEEFLSPETFEILKNDESYIGEIEELAMDLGNCYVCTECGKHAMVLNFQEGWSKCFYCGTLPYCGYTSCQLCQGKDTVVYDISNIEFNENNLRGYCYNCETHMTVYKCPECGCDYSYNSNNRPQFYNKCCKDNFKEFYNAGVLACPLCKKEKALPYYGSGINCLTKCKYCREDMCIYICPDCGETYVYDVDINAKIEKECCKNNFKEYW